LRSRRGRPVLRRPAGAVEMIRALSSRAAARTRVAPKTARGATGRARRRFGARRPPNVAPVWRPPVGHRTSPSLAGPPCRPGPRRVARAAPSQKDAPSRPPPSALRRRPPAAAPGRTSGPRHVEPRPERPPAPPPPFVRTTFRTLRIRGRVRGRESARRGPGNEGKGAAVRKRNTREPRSASSTRAASAGAAALRRATGRRRASTRARGSAAFAAPGGRRRAPARRASPRTTTARSPAPAPRPGEAR
jgi:hypothetical protein